MAGGSNGSTEGTPEWHKAVGISLALSSSAFIGTSFILKKKGLIDSNCLDGDGHAYLKSKLWWAGMILMAIGEFANFGAYAFTPAILVTPLGAVSVVVSAVLSSIFLQERLDFSAKIGCAQCLLGAIIIVFNAPETNSTSTLDEFYSYVITPGFLVYSLLILFVLMYLIYVLAPKYGKKHPIIYISVCSLIGSYLVLSTQGFGSAIVYSATNWETGNQFLLWQMYPLIVMVIFSIILQVNYLNKALNLFSTAIVTPVYYVFFTSSTIITSAVLFRGFKVSNSIAIVSILIGFLVIVGGVALLFEYNLKQRNLGSMMDISTEKSKIHIESEEHREVLVDMMEKTRINLANTSTNKHTSGVNRLNSANISTHSAGSNHDGRVHPYNLLSGQITESPASESKQQIPRSVPISRYERQDMHSLGGMMGHISQVENSTNNSSKSTLDHY